MSQTLKEIYRISSTLKNSAMKLSLRVNSMNEEKTDPKCLKLLSSIEDQKEQLTNLIKTYKDELIQEKD